jgi:hypothetical protein
MEAPMMFLDCPACLDEEGTLRCGLPAEVRCRYTMRSTDGPLEAAMIRCPAGHWFNGPIESLTWQREDGHARGAAGVISLAGRDSRQRTDDGRDGGGGFTIRDFPAGPRREVSRPSTAPAYYLGRPARLWITAMRPRRSRTASSHLTEAVTVADHERYPGAAASQPAADAAGSVPLTLA